MSKGLEELRLSSGLDIGDISRATGISSRYLRAIEKGDFDVVPGGIYVRGYIREYAKCLGIPFAEAIREYEAYLGKKNAGGSSQGRQAASRGNFLVKLNRLFHL